jgi:hypothetical protein
MAKGSDPARVDADERRNGRGCAQEPPDAGPSGRLRRRVIQVTGPRL